jgi:hypothetical protein
MAAQVLPRIAPSGPTLACDVQASLEAASILRVANCCLRRRCVDQLTDAFVAFLIDVGQVQPRSRTSQTLRAWLHRKPMAEVQQALRAAAAHWHHDHAPAPRKVSIQPWRGG